MTFYKDEKYLEGKGVTFVFEDGDESRHFLLDIAVLEKLANMKKIRSPASNSLVLLYHYRTEIYRLCMNSFRDSPAWSNERPYPINLSDLGR